MSLLSNECFIVTDTSTTIHSSPLHSDPDLDLVEERFGPHMAPEAMTTWTYGTCGCGWNLLPLVWSRHTRAFEITNGSASMWDSSSSSPIPTYLGPSRTPKNLFSRHPVDIFVTDHSGVTDTTATFGSGSTHPLPWYLWLDNCPPGLRPRILVQIWQPWTLWKDPGPTSKHARKPLERWGYSIRYKVLNGSRFGGPVNQSRLVIVCYNRIGSSKMSGFALETSVHLDPWDFKPSESGHRPMSNCLRPTGAGPTHDSLPEGLDLSPGSVPSSTRDPMPHTYGRWIHTPRGYRRLHADELARGLGIPKSWFSSSGRVPSSAVAQLIGIHLWEGISAGLRPLLTASPDPTPSTSPPSIPSPISEESDTPPTEPWTWSPPDLSLGRAWYRQRIRSLKRAARHYPECERSRLIAEGKRDLAVHRANYGPEGPQHLQILWWEFPREHWDDLRLGASMGFLTDPPTHFTPNSKLDSDQCAIAGEFVDELKALGILEASPSDDPIVANCPLFVVPKPGQPGQWRVIADCKKGGQNTTMGPGPVYLPQPHIILRQLYTGGWTAVVDASKFFHQFPTVISERKYLGVIHPVTGEHLRYAGLPMGTGSSPAIAGRFGAGFLRRLRTRHPDLFIGSPSENTWRRQVAEGVYNPSLGHGLGGLSSDGTPIALVFGFVDDFFIHAPTYAKCAAALNCFMDFAVDCGMLCNPAKCHPPSQRAKYCGFIFDTTGVPTLRVPQNKRSRARAMVEYLLSFKGAPVPRLSLSVVTGVLESQVPATSGLVGHTYLRRLYDATWECDLSLPSDLPPKDRYYHMVDLSPGAWDDLRWWHHHLQSDFGHPARPSRTATLVAHFGDGSGTGTGGTSQVVGNVVLDPPLLEMWMGRWSEHIHSHSSNWRELKTLELTLRREEARSDDRSRDTVLFYFTDNLVTYFVVTSGSARDPALQTLLYHIKELEELLGCHLEVVHIPGTSIIDQGSDDLSRGLWLSTDRSYVPASSLIPQLFEGVFLQDDWLSFLRTHISAFPTGDVTYCPWDFDLNTDHLFGQCSLWAPPAELAYLVLSRFLTLWTEQPSSTSAIFLLPRVLQRQWQRLSRFLIPLLPSPDSAQPKKDTFLFSDPSLPVYHRLPIIVLHLRPHTPCLPSPRLDPSASTIPRHQRLWYERQKDLLLRLQGED